LLNGFKFEGVSDAGERFIQEGFQKKVSSNEFEEVLKAAVIIDEVDSDIDDHEIVAQESDSDKEDVLMRDDAIENNDQVQDIQKKLF
jgi:hypothetical protein